MARPGWPERNRAARTFRQLRRFDHVINSDKVFGTHSYATIFLRRIMFRPWFRLIGRIGETGVDEYFLDPIPVPQTTPQAYRATFTAQRGGELFLYVNDAVIGLPWLNAYFFKRNTGSARVTVRLM